MEARYPDDSTATVSLDEATLAQTAVISLDDSRMDAEQRALWGPRDDWTQNPALILTATDGNMMPVCRKGQCPPDIVKDPV
jgi:hypothetical protein